MKKKVKVDPKDLEFLGDETISVDYDVDKKVLSRLFLGLYNNPLQSMARELIANSIDTTNRDDKGMRHIYADVFGEDALDVVPFFSVADFGEGMSEQFIRTHYSHIFDYAKTDGMGLFGVGSKSPLTYTDAFKVATVKDGIETSFLVSLSDEGSIELEFLGKVEGIGDDGTRVMVPLDRDTDDPLQVNEFLRELKDWDYDDWLCVKDYRSDFRFVQLCDDFVLDDNTGMTGRVFLRYDCSEPFDYRDLWCTMSRQIERGDYCFAMFPYVYSSFGVQGFARDVSGMFVFELKPGVVDFSVSRESILNNDKLKRLNSKVLERFGDCDKNMELFTEKFLAETF